MRHAAFDLESVLDSHVQIAGGTAGQRAALRNEITRRLTPAPEPPTPAVIVVLPRPDSRGEPPAVHVVGTPADVLVIDPPEWYTPDEEDNRQIALAEARQWLDFLAEHGIDPAGAAATAVAFAVADQLEALGAPWADLGRAYQDWRFAGPGDSPSTRKGRPMTAAYRCDRCRQLSVRLGRLPASRRRHAWLGGTRHSARSLLALSFS